MFGHSDGELHNPNRQASARTVVVGGAFALLLFTLLYYTVAQAQHSAYEDICHSNLVKLRHALLSYDGVHGSLPSPAIPGPDGTAFHSWVVMILPYLDSLEIDSDAIYDAYDMSEPWNGPNNRRLFRPVQRGRFACPCGPENQTTLTSYVVVVGEDTLFPGSRAASASDVPDGVDPILVIEITSSDIRWPEPRDLTIDDLESTNRHNSVKLTRAHAGVIRYITLRGKLGVMPAESSARMVAQLASAGSRINQNSE